MDENKDILKIIGNNIVPATNKRSIFITLLFSIFWFLFTNIDAIYCIKLIIFELSILYILAPIRPFMLEAATVKSSGTEVA